MKLVLKRESCTKTSTPGKLYLDKDGKQHVLCYTLEDVVREPGVKVYGQTAIPSGTYELIITMSTRFKRDLPLLVNVPNFSGVRIHGGNTYENTEGCILVGKYRNSLDRISNCAPMVSEILSLMRSAITKKERITIEIVPAGG